ncbi:Uncharacterised protein [Bordetella pertussis]|nr:Uncharacterised protein [Bordetella pertussis]CFW17245.1 Uncharacterised protein [Bordetella pertussis]CFW46009.1 Uncharacterised protein [Bordetella pertussis]CPL54124.1 Uncharacterised protein [Bordetella pertussis]CPP01066.1 Uncharacterised protein [Bordetella pertussis]
MRHDTELKNVSAHSGWRWSASRPTNSCLTASQNAVCASLSAALPLAREPSAVRASEPRSALSSCVAHSRTRMS